MTDNPMYDYPVTVFTDNARVARQPVLQIWSFGFTCGNVVLAGRVRITVKFDAMTNPVSVPRTYLRPVDE